MASLSVIIPTLNAGAHLRHALAPLVGATARGFVKQVIVADGGSTDETMAIAEAAGCGIIAGRRGRGAQMRAGAAAAKAGWLLFLHADTVLDSEWEVEAERFMAAPGSRMRAAAFTLAFDDVSRPARRVVFWARLRAKWLKLPYGDQGLLIARNFYEALGGHSDLPLMEDVELIRRIGAERIVLLEAQAITSAEKYRRDGFHRRAWRNAWLTTRYLFGADPVDLAKIYD